MIIPQYKHLREHLFQLAHDNMGHFRASKLYASLWDEFYWPHMWKNLMDGYILSCQECQRNKSQTTKAPGPLHPLPILDKCFESVALDFVGLLPKDNGYDTIVTMTDHLGANLQVVPCMSDMTAKDFAVIFFNKWYCENGCPLEIISNRDKSFVSKFWKVLMKLMGIKHKMSMAYHPQTDGASERTNKTVIQALRFHVECNQSRWA